MLIYAVADIHGRSDRLRAILANVAFYRPDVLVMAGDILAGRQPGILEELVSGISVPILSIGGNIDGRQLNTAPDRFASLKSLHLMRETVQGVEFVGISGTLPLPFHSRLGFREAGLEACAARLLSEHSVLVVHPPPRGTRDRVFGRFHAGSRAVARLVDRCSPRLVLCGHIHEQAGVTSRDRTVVVNCAMGRRGQGTLIRYDGCSVPLCRMLTQSG